jgi:hypothetical protein
MEVCGGMRNIARRRAIVIGQTVWLYESVGWNFPWVDYLEFEDAVCVGTCVFKGPPKDNKIEIAYHTFPEHGGAALRHEWQRSFAPSRKLWRRIFA